MGFLECSRCQGQMVPFTLADFFLVFSAWKCIQCGEIVDRVIMANRRLMAEAVKNGIKLKGDQDYVHHKGGEYEGSASQRKYKNYK